MEWYALKQSRLVPYSIHTASVCPPLLKGFPKSGADASLWSWVGEGKSVQSGQPDCSSLVCFGVPPILCFGGFRISSEDWATFDTRRMWRVVSRITPARHAHPVPGNSPPCPVALWVHSDTNCTRLRIRLSFCPSPNGSLRINCIFAIEYWVTTII